MGRQPTSTMPEHPLINADLHGNVPDQCPVALLIIDVINDMEFPGGEALMKQALPMARRIARLRDRASALRIPVIYVNDNFGRWRSDFRMLVQHCSDSRVRGHEVTKLLAPREMDYFVLKPKHSGFYATALDILLHYLRATTLIITGIAGDSCVLFTANDAYLRDYRLVVPLDCVASQNADDNRRAVAQMKHMLNADTVSSPRIDLQTLIATASGAAVEEHR